MIKIDTGDFFLIEPSELYAEQIAEYKQDFLDANSSMDGCGPLRRYENPIDYITECKKYTAHETLNKSSKNGHRKKQPPMVELGKLP